MHTSLTQLLAEAKPCGTLDLKDDFYRTSARNKRNIFMLNASCHSGVRFLVMARAIILQNTRSIITSHNQKPVGLMNVKVSEISTSS